MTAPETLDDALEDLAEAQRDLEIAKDSQRVAESELSALLESTREGVGYRTIIERAWWADPVATENDLLSAGADGDLIARLRVGWQVAQRTPSRK